MTSSFDASGGGLFKSSSGFAPNLNNKGNPKNALRFVNCMRNVNSTIHGPALTIYGQKEVSNI